MSLYKWRMSNMEIVQPRVIKDTVWGDMLELIPVACGTCNLNKSCDKQVNQAFVACGAWKVKEY